MSSSLLQRARFHSAADEPAQAEFAQVLLRLLLHQDGSTTRLLEAMSDGDLRVQVIDQGFLREVPPPLAASLAGKTVLRRLTSLEVKGRVLLDSLAYIAAEALPASMVQELVDGVRPIGHVLASLWTRRVFRPEDAWTIEELGRAVGLPDPPASRSTAIVTPAGPCMVLAETFRRGVLDLALRHDG
jgi:chorismate-pyruvate lyase